MRSRRLCLSLVAVALVASATFLSTATDAATPAERTASVEVAAAWLADRFEPGGYIADLNGDPDFANTAQSALALAAAASQESTFDVAVAFLEANVNDYVAPGGGDDSVGALGYLLLLADAAGIPGTDFGGEDLVARLQGTLGDLEPGLYGASDPTFDGVYRQGLAVLGLVAHGVAPDTSATEWLTDQQCGADSPPDAEGGWEAYRADTGVPCGPPDPISFTGPDSNSTALAVQALASLGAPPVPGGLAFLDATQADNGGWAFIDGLEVDPNSTALVIQAIVSGGEDPDGGRWRQTGGSAYESLMAWQIMSGDPTDVGGFASPFSDGFADLIATQQAVWGVAGLAFPFGPVVFGGPDGPDGPDESVATTDTSDGATAGATTRPRFTG